MPVAVPFPTEATVDLALPSAEGVLLITRGLATGAAGPNGLTDTQRAVLNALTTSMTGITVDVANVEPLGPDELADALRFRNHEFRTRIIQVMLLAELLLVPLPPEVTDQVESPAGRLGVCDDIMRVAREVSHGSMGLALIDFERSGYFQHLHVRCRRRGTPPPRTTNSSRVGVRWRTVPTVRSARESIASTGRVVLGSPGIPNPRRRSWPSTTSSTCSPTTGQPSSLRSRCSDSSREPTTTPQPLRSSRWCSACSRPATSRPRRKASSASTCARISACRHDQNSQLRAVR